LLAITDSSHVQAIIWFCHQYADLAVTTEILGFVMKLIYQTITTLGITTLLGVLTSHAVQAQPTLEGTTTLVSQINASGSYHSSGGIYQGNFYYPGGGSFYRGYLNNQGNGLYQGNIYNPSHGSIYQGTFYYPNNGGNFHGLFYNQSSGRVIRGNFYNPGPSPIDQGNVYNPVPGVPYYPGNVYNQAPAFGNRRDYKREIEYYNQAIRRNPKLVDSYNKRALARFVLGDQPGTIQDLQKAASLYLQQGDKDRYQQTLETIREMQPVRTDDTRTK